MDTKIGVHPHTARPAESEPSPEELLAELERVVSRVKSGWGNWNQLPSSSSDDLLPKPR